VFDTALANFCGLPGSLCFFAETCGQQLVLEHNGDLYSCDHYVEPGYLLGNITERHMLELANLPRQRSFGQDKRDTLTAYCRDCDVRFACNGGCPKDRFAISPYGEPGSSTFAPATRRFFSTSAADGCHGAAHTCAPGSCRADARLRRRRQAPAA